MDPSRKQEQTRRGFGPRLAWITIAALVGAGAGLWGMMSQAWLPLESRPVSNVAGDCKMAGHIDGDGDLDIVSIAFFDAQLVHLWANE